MFSDDATRTQVAEKHLYTRNFNKDFPINRTHRVLKFLAQTN